MYKIETEKYYKSLIDEYYFLKPTSNVKKMIVTILSLMVQRLGYNKEEMVEELKILLIKNLDYSFNSDKPDLSVIKGSLTALRHLLKQIAISEEELKIILKYALVGIQKIKDVNHYKIIKSGLKLLSKHIDILIEYTKGRELEIFNIVLDLFKNTNRRLKEKASNFLVSLCYALAKLIVTNLNENFYTDLLDCLVRKLRYIIQKEEDPVVLITCIKAYGCFGAAICQLEGVKKLHEHFYFLIENSQSSIFLKIDKIENFHFEKNPQNFKSVLFNQKMLIGYLASFAFIIVELDDLEHYETNFLCRIINLSLKHLLNYFPPYKKALTTNFSLLLNSLPTINYTSFIFRSYLNELVSNVEQKCELSNIESLKVYYDFFEAVLTVNLDSDKQKRLLEEFLKLLIDLMDKKDTKLAIFADTNVSYLKENKKCFGCHAMLMFFEKITSIPELKMIVETNAKSLQTLFGLVNNKLEAKYDNFLYTRCLTILLNYDSIKIQVLQHTKIYNTLENIFNFLTHSDEVLHTNFYKLLCVDFCLEMPEEVKNFTLPELCYMLYDISKNQLQCKPLVHKGLKIISRSIHDKHNSMDEIAGSDWINRLKTIANSLRLSTKDHGEEIYSLILAPNTYPHQEIIELLPLFNLEDIKQDDALKTTESKKEILYVNFELLNKSFTFNLSSIFSQLVAKYSIEHDTVHYHAIISYIVKYLVHFNITHKRGPENIYETLENSNKLLCKMVASGSPYLQTELDNLSEVLELFFYSPHIVEIITLKIVDPLVNVTKNAEQPQNLLGNVLSILRSIVVKIDSRLPKNDQTVKYKAEFMNYLRRIRITADYTTIRLNLEIILLVCQNELIDLSSNETICDVVVCILNQLIAFQMIGIKNMLEFSGLMACLRQVIWILNSHHDKLNSNPLVSSESMEIENHSQENALKNNILVTFSSLLNSFNALNLLVTYNMCAEMLKLKLVKDIWSHKLSKSVDINTLAISEPNQVEPKVLIWFLDNLVYQPNNNSECLSLFNHENTPSLVKFMLLHIIIDTANENLFERILTYHPTNLVDLLLNKLPEINTKHLKNLISAIAHKNPEASHQFISTIIESISRANVLFNFDINDTSIRKILKLSSKYISRHKEYFKTSKRLSHSISQMYNILKEKSSKKASHSLPRKKLILQFLLRIENFDYGFLLDIQTDNSQIEYRTIFYSYIKRSKFANFENYFYHMYLTAYNSNKLTRITAFLKNLELEVINHKNDKTKITSICVDFINAEKLNDETIENIFSVSALCYEFGYRCEYTNEIIYKISSSLRNSSSDIFKLTNIVFSNPNNHAVYSSLLSLYNLNLKSAFDSEVENVSTADLNELKNIKITGFVDSILNGVIYGKCYQHLSILFSLFRTSNTGLIENFEQKIEKYLSSVQINGEIFDLAKFLINTWLSEIQILSAIDCGRHLYHRIFYLLLNKLSYEEIVTLVEIYFSRVLTVDLINDTASDHLNGAVIWLSNTVELVELTSILKITNSDVESFKLQLYEKIEHLESLDVHCHYQKEISKLYALYFNMKIIDLILSNKTTGMYALLNYCENSALYNKIFATDALSFNVLTNFDVVEFSSNFKWFTLASRLYKENICIFNDNQLLKELVNAIGIAKDIELDEINKHPSVPYLTIFIQILNLVEPIGTNYHTMYSRLTQTPNLSTNTHMIKVITNSPELFEEHKNQYAEPLCTYLTTKGYSNGFHYYMRDICCLLIKWFDNSDTGIPIFSDKQQLLHKKILGCLADHSDIISRNNLEIYKKFLSMFKKSSLNVNLNDIEQLLKVKKSSNDINLWKTTAIKALEYIIELDCNAVSNGEILAGRALAEYILNNHLLLMINTLHSNCKGLLISIAGLLALISNKDPDYYFRISDELQRYLRSQNIILNEKLLAFLKHYMRLTSEAKYNNSKILQLILSANVTITIKAKCMVLKIAGSVIDSGEIDYYIIEEVLGYIGGLLKNNCTPLMIYIMFSVIQSLSGLSKYKNTVKLAEIIGIMFGKLKTHTFEIKPHYISTMINVLDKLDMYHNIEYICRLSHYFPDFAATKQVIEYITTKFEFKTVLEIMKVIIKIEDSHFANLFFIYICSLKSLNADVERLGFKFTDNIGKQKEAVNDFNTLSYDKTDTLNTFSDSYGNKTMLNKNNGSLPINQQNENSLTQQFVYQDNFFRFNKSNTHIMPLTLKKSYYKVYQKEKANNVRTSDQCILGTEGNPSSEPSEVVNLSGLLFKYCYQNEALAEDIYIEFLSSLYTEIGKAEQSEIFRLYLKRRGNNKTRQNGKILYKFFSKTGVANIDFDDINDLSAQDPYLVCILLEERLKTEKKEIEHADKRIHQSAEEKLVTAPKKAWLDNLGANEYAQLHEFYQNHNDTSSSTRLLSFLKDKVPHNVKELVTCLEKGFDDFIAKVVQDPYLAQHKLGNAKDIGSVAGIIEKIITEAHKKALFYCQKWQELKEIATNSICIEEEQSKDTEVPSYLTEAFLYDFENKNDLREFFSHKSLASVSDEIDKNYCRELLLYHISCNSIQHARYFSFILRDKIINSIVNLDPEQKNQVEAISFNTHVYTKCSKFMDMIDAEATEYHKINELILLSNSNTDMKDLIYDYNMSRAFIANLPLLSEVVDVELAKTHEAILEINFISKLVKLNQLFIAKLNLRKLDDFYYVIKNNEKIAYDFTKVVVQIAIKSKKLRNDSEFVYIAQKVVEQMDFLSDSEYWLDYEVLRMKLTADKLYDVDRASPITNEKKNEIIGRVKLLSASNDQPLRLNKILKITRLLIENTDAEPDDGEGEILSSAIDLYIDNFNRRITTKHDNDIMFIFKLIDVHEPLVSRIFREKHINIKASELLPWIPQLILKLDSPLSSFVMKCLQEIINEYPQMIAHYLYYYRNSPVLIELVSANKNTLEVYFEFFDELVNSFYDPEIILEDELIALEARIGEVEARQAFINCVDRMLKIKTPVYKSFLQRIQSNLQDFINDIIKNKAEPILKEQIKALKQKAAGIFKQRYTRRNFHVSAFSSKLANFSEHFKSLKYFNKKNVTIVDTVKQISVIGSLRKPKCISFFCSDGRIRKLLIKTGEDLRADAQIMTFNHITNDLIKKHKHYFESQPNKLKAFNVLPLGRKIGIIEWVESSSLKELVESTVPVSETPAMNYRKTYLSQVAQDMTVAHLELYKETKENVIEQYNKELRAFGPNKLGQVFMSLYDNAEDYYKFKKKMETDYAIQCALGYLLGIGDRHLDNILMTHSHKQIFMIDFNCCLNAGVHLKVPELLPFRLTQNLTNLMLPFGVKGNFRAALASTLQLFFEYNWLYMDHLNLFVKEPLDTCFETNKASKIPRSEVIVQTVKDKFRGLNPKSGLISELQSSRHFGSPYYENILRVINQIKVSSSDEYLDIYELGNVLLDLATDKQLLGRTWIGWMSFV